MVVSTRDMIIIVPAFILGGVVTHVAKILFVQQAIDWPTTFQALQNIAQTLAFLFAGVWTYRLFVRQRTERTRANITQEVTHVLLNAEHRLLRVVLQIQNVGSVEICPWKGDITIHKIKPIDEKLLEGFISNPTIFASQTPEETWASDQKCSLDFKGDKLTLEPNEIERYTRDFILPSTVAVIQVHSVVYMHDESKGLYWDETTLVSLI